MSDVILAAMIAAAVLLPAAIVARCDAAAPTEAPHESWDCAHCTRLFADRPSKGGA